MYRRKRVLSKRFRAPITEWRKRPNGILNKFTTHSMLNEIGWAFGESEFPAAGFVETQEGWSDLHLSPGASPVTLERAQERRVYLRDYFRRIMQADVVVLTLGLVETWHDALSGVYLNAPPPVWSVEREPERFSMCVTDYESNLGALREMRSLLQTHCPKPPRLIVTVSPVPLGLAFSGEDAALANMYSKSVLRVVAGDFCRQFADAAYFPSYEMVMLTDRSRAFTRRDELHVEDAVVREVIGEFLAIYVGDVDDPPDFVEMDYLNANPEVDARVRAGELESGFEHWLANGSV